MKLFGKRGTKNITNEEADKFVEEMKEKHPHMSEEEILDIKSKVMETSFYKSNGLLGLKEWKDPLVFFIRDDGEVEILEDMRSGIMKIDIGGEKVRYALEPKKMQLIKSPNGNFVKAWFLHESESFAYPVEPVFDSEQFNSILKQEEGLGELREYNARSWLKILLSPKTATFFITVVIGIGILMMLLNQYAPNILGSSTVNYIYQNATNIPQGAIAVPVTP